MELPAVWNAEMIRIADRTQKLDRLIAFDCPEDQICSEFDRVCRELFGFDRMDVDWDRFDAQSAKIDDCVDEIARRNGFDIFYDEYNEIQRSDFFVDMILAKELGCVPDEGDGRAAQRLSNEASLFVENRKS